MNLNLKNLARLGFKSNTVFATKTSVALLWREKTDRVEYASGYPPETLGAFALTPSEIKKFRAGKLSLVPAGFCSPMAGQRQTRDDGVVLHQGHVRSAAHLEKVFSASAWARRQSRQAGSA